jgi:hypothetical protein
MADYQANNSESKCDLSAVGDGGGHLARGHFVHCPGVKRRWGFDPSPAAAVGRNLRQGQTMIGNFHGLGNSREVTIMERKLRDENVSAR